MAMGVGARADGPMFEINTTPLIDVLLVLLIMLMIALPAMTHSVSLNMPGGGKNVELPDPVGVFVEFDGALLWNGTVLGDLRELERRMSAESQRVPQPMLDVRADRRAKYDTVAHVLAIAQRSGMRNIAIEGTP
jgi:biopolymer transport protein ExbD